MTDKQMFVLAGLICFVPHFHPRVSLVLGLIFMFLGLVS